MYYIDHIQNNNYAIADTKDGVVELISNETYISYINSGVEILSWFEAKKQVTMSMNERCNMRVFNKLKYLRSENDIADYLSEHSIFELTNLMSSSMWYIDWSLGCKFFDYTETKGFMVILGKTSIGTTVIVKLNELGKCIVNVVSDTWKQDKYPSGSGYMYKRLCNQSGVECPSFKDDNIYLLFYSNSALIFIDISIATCSGTLTFYEVTNKYVRVLGTK